jgi:hypothetical protein
MRMSSSVLTAAGVLLAAVGLQGCTGRAAPSSPQIRFNTELQPSGVVDVVGLPAASLAALSRATLTDADWQALLSVSVKSGGSITSSAGSLPVVAGKYGVVQEVVRFTPLFPFDEGREYAVVFDPSRLPGGQAYEPWRTQVLRAVVGRPAVARSPSTVVTHVHPSGDVVPANQLRMYLHFSAPMDWRSGFDYLTLLDENGREVVDAFLPLDADFWNDDRTRYTVFFDPGRVKRGILPNKQMGRALEAGRRYTLVVKREWRDGHGLPLKEEFRREFRAAPAIERPLSTSTWKIALPASGTRAPLTVTFPEPLDHGLLRRALGLARDGTRIEGEIAIEAAETRWVFTPSAVWSPGEYQLVALSFLEDLAGNRIGRAFEVDNFERTDRTPEPERTTLTFKIAR